LPGARRDFLGSIAWLSCLARARRCIPAHLRAAGDRRSGFVGVGLLLFYCSVRCGLDLSILVLTSSGAAGDRLSGLVGVGLLLFFCSVHCGFNLSILVLTDSRASSARRTGFVGVGLGRLFVFGCVTFGACALLGLNFTVVGRSLVALLSLCRVRG
jgi:hypothetical protein